ncbi:MAG TPA: type II toxin-antitoxin system VapC family toxin [Candidatus Sulfotelmatobacter sp.]|nr:type II toxin-antitoxin system VapC family toxin [Candidatus Sulfotelmatobacter sp.]
MVDANLLLYTVNRFSEQHASAKKWWDAQLSGADTVGLSWQVVHAFVRISSNTRLFKCALTLDEAIECVQSWLDQPCVRILQPTENHWKFFQQMLRAGHATANLVSDAHLAALAVEHNCVLHSTDTDFARFRGLKWKNPIA